jgi:autophagy-related protein 9
VEEFIMNLEPIDGWATIYDYFYQRGVSSYIFSSLPDLGTAFLVSIAPILLVGCVNYSAIKSAEQLSDVLFPFSEGWCRSNILLKLCSIVFFVYTFVKAVRFLVQLYRFRSVHRYFTDTLGIHDSELLTMKWSQVVESVAVNDHTLESPRLEVSQQILRTENYICSLISDPSTLIWTGESAGTDVRRIPMSEFFIPLLTLTLKGIVIDGKGSSLLNDPQSNQARIQNRLQWRFRVFGICLLLFSPVVLAFEITYFVYDFIRTIRKCGVKFSLRAWSPVGKWLFREYNELPHRFHARIAKSYQWANRYLDHGPSVFVRPISRLVGFISGSLVVVFIIVSMLTDIRLVFSGHMLFGKSGGWYVMVLSIIYMVARSLSQPSEEETRESAMAKLEKQLHYDFRDESHSVNSEHTVDRVRNLFPSILMQIWLELSSVLMNPFLFAVYLPVRADSIIDFMRRNSAERGALGWISAFSTFDVGERGFTGSADQREKVLRSIRTFECDSDVLLGIETARGGDQGLSDDTDGEFLIPRPSSPLIRTDFGGSNEALNQLDGAETGDFFSAPDLFD